MNIFYFYAGEYWTKTLSEVPKSIRSHRECETSTQAQYKQTWLARLPQWLLASFPSNRFAAYESTRPLERATQQLCALLIREAGTVCQSRPSPITRETWIRSRTAALSRIWMKHTGERSLKKSMFNYAETWTSKWQIRDIEILTPWVRTS